MTLNEFFRQLRRRSVFHVAGVYAVVCWLLVQITAVAAPALGLPEWTTRLAIALTFIGVPIAIGVAWFVHPRRHDGREVYHEEPRHDIAPAAMAASSDAARHGAPAPRTATRGYVIAAVVVLAAAAVAGYLMQIRTVPDAAVDAPLSSIAVLPFVNLSADVEDEYFSDGVTEDILTQLTKIDGLRVISRTSAMRYKGSGKSVREIGRELDVATVLEGAVRRSAGRVRVSAQLVDANRDQQLWAETYDRDLADIFAIQSEIAHSIVRALQTALSPGRTLRSGAPPTADMEAYHLYLRGRFFWNRRTEEGLRRAIDLFEQAIQRDSAFALAYAGLADALVVLPFHGNSPRAEAHAAAFMAAQRALALDSLLGEAHAALGYVHFWSREWIDSEREFRLALRLNPGYATAHQWYAFLQAYRGRPDDAIATTRRALELDPLSVIINWNLGYFLQYSRRFDEALRQYRLTLELEPGLPVAHEQILRIHEQRGDFAAYVAEMERFEGVGGAHDVQAEQLTAAHARAGWPAVFRTLLSSPAGVLASPARRAEWHAALGEYEQAMHLLEDEIATGATVDLQSPAFDAVRGSARFRALQRSLGLESSGGVLR